MRTGNSGETRPARGIKACSASQLRTRIKEEALFLAPDTSTNDLYKKIWAVSKNEDAWLDFSS